MWGFSKNNKPKPNKFKLDTMIGPNTTVNGDVEFSDFLVLDGTVNGNVIAEDASRLALNHGGRIVGDVRVPDIYIDGEVEGDVYATDRVELANNARIKGNVYYNLLEMEMGAAINGNLVHKPKSEMRLIEHSSSSKENDNNSEAASKASEKEVSGSDAATASK